MKRMYEGVANASAGMADTGTGGMPMRPLPRPVRVRRPLLQALIAPAVVATALGCSTGIAIVDNPDLSETGAHYIDARWRGGMFRYEVGSALPGDPERAAWRPLPVPEELASQAAQAADYVARAARLRPPLHPVVTGVPAGARAVAVQRFRATGSDALLLPLVVRYIEGDERHARSAVRRVAHESTHLIAAFHRRGQVGDEWAASVIESCAEQAIFGTTRGHVFRDELAKPPPSFDRAQRASVLDALRAIADVRRALEGGDTAAMGSLCESAFARVRPR